MLIRVIREIRGHICPALSQGEGTGGAHNAHTRFAVVIDGSRWRSMGCGRNCQPRDFLDYARMVLRPGTPRGRGTPQSAFPTEIREYRANLWSIGWVCVRTVQRGLAVGGDGSAGENFGWTPCPRMEES